MTLLDRHITHFAEAIRDLIAGLSADRQLCW
jgi:hypothetical protein